MRSPSIRYARHARDRLVQGLEQWLGPSAIVAAYLFGSRARGDARASSDVDIGIWLEQAPRALVEYPFELGAQLEEAVGLHVDLVVLNGAPADLIHRVLRDGDLLLKRDRAARVHFDVPARSEYFDMLPIWNEYRRTTTGSRP